VIMSRAHAFMRGLMLASIVAGCLVPFSIWIWTNAGYYYLQAPLDKDIETWIDNFYQSGFKDQMVFYEQPDAISYYEYCRNNQAMFHFGTCPERFDALPMTVSYRIGWSVSEWRMQGYVTETYVDDAELIGWALPPSEMERRPVNVHSNVREVGIIHSKKRREASSRSSSVDKGEAKARIAPLKEKGRVAIEGERSTSVGEVPLARRASSQDRKPSRPSPYATGTRYTTEKMEAVCVAASSPTSSEVLDICARWLMDTGCRHDLIAKEDALSLVNEAMEVEPLPFNTAGGRKVSKHMIPMRAEGFGRQSAAVANAYLMEKTPPVLSVGKRVHWHGCSFVWMNGFSPLHDN